MTGPAKGPQQAQPSGPTPTDRTFVYQSFRHAEASGTWTADAAYPADSPVPYTLTAKAETLLGEPGSPEDSLAERALSWYEHAPVTGPAWPPRPAARLRYRDLRAAVRQRDPPAVPRMKDPEPEPEAGL